MKTDAELLAELEARIANGERFIADYRGMKVEAIGLCFTCKRPRGSRHDCPGDIPASFSCPKSEPEEDE